MSMKATMRRLLAKICILTVFMTNGFGNVSWAAIVNPKWKGEYHNCLSEQECLDGLYDFFSDEEEYFEKRGLDPQKEMYKEILRLCNMFDEDPSEYLGQVISLDYTDDEKEELREVAAKKNAKAAEVYNEAKKEIDTEEKSDDTIKETKKENLENKETEIEASENKETETKKSETTEAETKGSEESEIKKSETRDISETKQDKIENRDAFRAAESEDAGEISEVKETAAEKTEIEEIERDDNENIEDNEDNEIETTESEASEKSSDAVETEAIETEEDGEEKETIAREETEETSAEETTIKETTEESAESTELLDETEETVTETVEETPISTATVSDAVNKATVSEISAEWEALLNQVKGQKPKYQDEYCSAIRNDLATETEYTYEDDEVIITATVVSETGESLPEDAALTAVRIENNSDTYREAQDKLEEKAEVSDFVLYDIYFEDSDGEEVEPVDAVVSVKLNYRDGLKFEDKELTEESEVTVYHLEEQKNGETEVKKITQEVDLDSDGLVQEVNFETGSFSLFAITVNHTQDLFEPFDLNLSFVDQNGNIQRNVSGTYVAFVTTEADISNPWWSGTQTRRVAVPLHVEQGVASGIVACLYSDDQVMHLVGEGIYEVELASVIPGKNPSITPTTRYDQNSFQLLQPGEYIAGEYILSTEKQYRVDGTSHVINLQAKAVGDTVVSRDEIVSELGDALQYAVVADKFQIDGHIEGNIAVSKMVNGGELQNTDSVLKKVKTLNITLTKHVSPAVPKDTTFRFGVFSLNSDAQRKLIRTEDVLVEKGNTSGQTVITLSRDGGFDRNNGFYQIYELDADGNIIEEGQQNGDYTVSYQSDTISTPHTSISGSGSTSYVGTVNGTLRALNGSMSLVTTMPEAKNWSGFIRVDVVSENEFGTLAPIAQYLENAKQTSEKLASARTGKDVHIYYLTPEQAMRHEFTLDNYVPGETVILNIVIPKGTDSVNLSLDMLRLRDAKGNTYNIDNADGWSELARDVLWNYITEDGQAYTGSVTNVRMVPGTHLLPSGTLTAGGSSANSMIANSVIQSNEIHKVTFAEPETRAVEIECTNRLDNIRTGSLKLTKVDSENNSIVLNGAKFQLYKVGENGAADSPVNAEFTITDNGSYTVDHLEFGTYYFVETAAPTGYEMPTGDDAKTAPITINAENAGTVQSVTMQNTKLCGALKILKKDGTTPLAGAVFDLYRCDNAESQHSHNNTPQMADITVPADGIVIENLEYGRYALVETQAPSGYILPDYPVTHFEIGSGDTTANPKTIEIANSRILGGFTFVKQDDQGNVLPGAVFTLYKKNASGEYVSTGMTFTSGSDGTVSCEQNLGIGEYVLKETTVPEGYAAAEDIAFTISKAGILTLGSGGIVVDSRKKGKAELEKKDAADGHALAGVTFELYQKNAGSESQLKATLVTDNSGKASVDNLEWGSYYLKETKAATGYIADSSRVYEFTIDAKNQSTSFTGEEAILNERAKGSIQIEKTDEATGEPLSAVTFALYKKNADSDDTSSWEKLDQADLVTGNDGKASCTGLDWGTYNLKESSVPTGYEDATGTDHVFTIDAEHLTKTFTGTDAITNRKKDGSVQLQKVDKEDNSLTLAGAAFVLYSQDNHKNGNVVSNLVDDIKARLNGGYYEYGTYTTDENGTILVSGLPWDNYCFVETAAPNGYVLNSTPHYFAVNQSSVGDTIDVKAENERIKGSLTLVKKASGPNGQALEGAEFDLYKVGEMTPKQRNLTTDDNGEITVSDLTWGTYFFVETKASDGYITPAGEAAKSAELTINAEKYDAKTGLISDRVEVTNDKIQGYVKLTKTFDGKAGTSAQNAGVRLELYKKGAGLFGTDQKISVGQSTTLTLQQAGTLTVGPLDSGIYYFKETASPDGYPVSKNTPAFAITAAGTVEAAIQVGLDNTAVSSSASFKKVDTADIPIEGAVFALYRVDGENVSRIDELTSGADGTVTSGPRGVGTYYFKEIRNEGYKENDTLYYFEITKESGSEVAVHAGNLNGTIITQVVNEPQWGRAQLIKTDSDGNTLPGAFFSVYRKSDNVAIAARLISDKNGVVRVTNLDWGTYYFVETQAPAGYMLDTTHYEFTISRSNASATQYVDAGTAVNRKILANVRLVKTDADDQDQPITAGEAVFSLYDENDVLIQSGLKTNTRDGSLTYQNLPEGRYYFVETEAPAGYEIQKDEHGEALKYRFAITAADHAATISLGNIPNHRTNGSVVLTKMDANDSGRLLPGATFKLYKDGSDQEIDTQTTDASGKVSFTDLAWGQYRLVETEAPAGYRLAEDEAERSASFTIDGRNPYMVKIERTMTNEAYKGSIELTKTEKGTDAAVAGAVFELYQMSDTVGGADQKINSLTDAENGYYTTDEAGRIRVENLSLGTYYFKEISAPTGYIQPTAATCRTDSVAITAENVRQSIETPLAITFTNTKVLGNVELWKVDQDDNQKGLEGAVFSLYQAVTGEDGQVQLIEPAIQTGLTTDEDGKLFYRDLTYGSYAFVETSAPQGYLLDATPISFRIGENDNGRAVALTFTNSRIRAGVQFTKRDASDTAIALNGAVFGLYQKAEGVGESDQYLGDVVSSKIDGQDGIVRKDGLGAGSYYFTEKQAPAGYQTASENRIEFTIAAADNGKVLNLDTLYTVTNERQNGELYLIKYGESKAVTLSGAAFDLYREREGEEIENVRIPNPDTADGSYVTDADGRITVSGLAWGTYYFSETAAPAGYGINETVENHRITLDSGNVTADASLRTLEVTDEPIIVQIDKVDKDTKESLSNAALALYDAEDVNAESGRIKNGAQPLTSWTSEAGHPKAVGTILTAGRSYAVVETEAPAGYQTARPVTFTLNADGTLAEDTENHTVLVEDIRYEAIDLELQAKKVLNGSRALQAGEFGFELTEEQAEDSGDGSILIDTKANTEDGQIVFGKITYTDEGVHTYKISEIKGNEEGISYSEAIYTVKAEVKDSGDGGLKLTLTYTDTDGKEVSDDELIFINSYSGGDTPGSSNPGGSNPGGSNPGGGGSGSSGGSGGSNARSVISDEQVPLSALPDNGSSADDVTVILDEAVPLSALAKTGDHSQTALLSVLAALSAGLAAYFASRLKKESEDDD